MADIVGTGHPDGEDRAMPHGDVILAATGQSAAAAGTTVSFAGFGQPVAGYRSLVIVVDNTGAFDIVVTPRWNFYGAAAAVYSEANQTVKAGTKKRLLFQNEADELTQVTYTGQGGASGFGHYIAGSNLDPLARSAPDYLILYGISRNVDNPVTGDNDHAKFDAATYKTNDASLWSFVLDAGGRIKEVDTSAPGRYESFVQGKWVAAGAAFTKTMVLDVFGVGPIGMSPDVSTNSATQEEMFVGAFTEMISGTAQWDVNVAHNFAGNVAFIAPYWWIKRWAI